MGRDREADLATLRTVHAAAQARDFPQAAAMARPALDSGLEHPLLYNVLAIGLEQDGRLEDAATLLGRAATLFPADSGVRNALGLCLLRLERPADALEQFDALLALEPALPFAHASRGAALLSLGALAKADASYRRALELDPSQPVALAGLAQVAVRRGLHREAGALADRALALMPGYPDAAVSRAAADLGEGATGQAVARLQSLLADNRLGPLDRAYASGLLGDALDAEDRAAEAFEAYGRCNSELRRHHAQRYATQPSALESVRAMTAYFEGATPEEWRAPGAPVGERSPVRAHLFVLGFPRSGTTLLEVALEGHPDAVSLGENELLIDGVREYLRGPEALARLSRAGRAELARLRAAYWARAVAAGAGPAGGIFVDKHPLNTLKLPLIARLFPAARIVFLYRDPRDVVLSCFRRRFQMSAPMYELLSLDGAARFYDAVMHLAERLDAVLPSATRRVRYEALALDFDAEMRGVCAFLGIEWSGEMREFGTRIRERASATPSTAQLARGLDASGIGGWRRYRAQLAPVLPLLERWVACFGYEP